MIFRYCWRFPLHHLRAIDLTLKNNMQRLSYETETRPRQRGIVHPARCHRQVDAGPDSSSKIGSAHLGQLLQCKSSSYNVEKNLQSAQAHQRDGISQLHREVAQPRTHDKALLGGTSASQRADTAHSTIAHSTIAHGVRQSTPPTMEPQNQGFRQNKRSGYRPTLIRNMNTNGPCQGQQDPYLLAKKIPYRYPRGARRIDQGDY